MSAANCVPFDAAWQFDVVIPAEKEQVALPSLPDDLDVDGDGDGDMQMQDRIDLFSANESLHDDDVLQHDPMEPLPLIDCSSPTTELFYAPSRRQSGCSVTKGGKEVTLPPSNIRFVSPMQTHDRRVSTTTPDTSRHRLPKRIQSEMKEKPPRKLPRTRVEPRAASNSSRCRRTSDACFGNCDDDRDFYEYYRHSAVPDLAKHENDWYFHGPRVHYNSPHAIYLTRDRMVSFMHRTEETRAQILMHLPSSLPSDSPVPTRTNVENFHSTRLSSHTLFHSWFSYHEYDRYP